MAKKYQDYELIEYRDALRNPQKMGTDNVERVLRVLLSAEINKAQLITTQISKTISSLSTFEGFQDKNDNRKINKLCLLIVAKWRKLVKQADTLNIVQNGTKIRFKENQSNLKDSITSIPSTNSKNCQHQQIKDQNKPPTSITAQNQMKRNVLPEIHNKEKDQILYEIPVYKDDPKKERLPVFRSVSRNQGLQAINKLFEPSRRRFSINQKEWINLIVRLESAIFERNQMVMSYKSNIREVLGMFSSSNVIFQVLNKIISKQVSIFDVAEGSSEVFLSDEQKDKIRRDQEKELGLNEFNSDSNIRMNFKDNNKM